MFDRLTARARRVIALAHEEARALEHDSVGTEHILLGLARDNQSVAGRILLDLGAEPEKIRNAVIRMTGARPTNTTAIPNLDASSLEDLDDLIDQLVDEELEISYRRRIVHGKLEILWVERERRRGGFEDAGS